MELMKDSLWLAWHTDREAGVITFAAGRSGDGWLAVAVGEEQNGGMRGADILAVHEMHGEVILQDMHSTKYERPDVDRLQNAELLSHGPADGYYRAQFRRPLMSCDPQDHGIRKNFPHVLIWALGMGFNFGYHGAKARGSVVVNFDDPDPLVWFGGTPNVTGLPSFRAVYHNYLIPTAPRPDTRGGIIEGTNQYKCLAVRLKNVTDREPPFDILVSKPIVGSEFIHHFINFQCSGDPRPDPSIPYGQNPDNDVYNCAMGGGPQCDPMGGWAVGGTMLISPRGTGARIRNQTRWLVFNTHFYNPSLRQDARDSSGFEFVLADTLQPETLGTLWMGVTPTMVLPPGQKEAAFGFHCAPEHLALLFPGDRDELTLVVVLHHLHALGSVARTYIVRDGKRIPLAVQNNFDYNFQATLPITGKLRKGDALEVYCGFDTRGVDGPVRWGERTQDEMCLSVIMFYPAREELLQSFCTMYDLPKHNDPAAPTTTWTLLMNTVQDPVYKAMLSGCRTPPAACPAGLWNAVCHKTGPCYLEEVCDANLCRPNDGTGLLAHCSAVKELCRACWEDGPGQCTDCIQPCQKFIDSGALLNATEVMRPAPSRGQAYNSSERWYDMEHDLPWGKPWAEDLSPQCAPSCVGCDRHSPRDRDGGQTVTGGGHGHAGGGRSNIVMIAVIVFVAGLLPASACVGVGVYLKTRRDSSAKVRSASPSSVVPQTGEPGQAMAPASPTSPTSPTSPAALVERSVAKQSGAADGRPTAEGTAPDAQRECLG